MKKAMLVLMTVAAVGASHVAAASAANLPEGQVSNGSTPPREESDSAEGFMAFISDGTGSDEEAMSTNMPEAQVGSGAGN